MSGTIPSNKFLSDPADGYDQLPMPATQRGLLNTEDRVSEILFGIIMTLTFTCTYSVISSDGTPLKNMLHGAIGSTIAWGIVDAVMYLIMLLTYREREFTFLNFIQKSKDKDKANQLINDSLPAAIAQLMPQREIEALRQKLLHIPAPTVQKRLTFKDYMAAIFIFLIVIFSTFPVVLPFLFFEDTPTAMRVSNFIAILMMFGCGWSLGKYAGRKSFYMGMMVSLIGIVLVLTTILLGG
jgi:hypothetical protein